MAVMNDGLGGPAGYGENSFKINGTDYVTYGPYDDSAVKVDVTSVFGSEGLNYFGTNYSEVWINSNGLVTFDSANTSYSPSGIAGLDFPAIAPFWTDLDIGKGGDIYWDLDPEAGTFTITWHDARAYQSNVDGTNTFQLVLTKIGDGDFDVEFIYEDIQFTDGYAGHATSGFTDGELINLELEGSGDPGTLSGYETNDFDAGDSPGTLLVNVRDGLPHMNIVRGTDGDDRIDGSFVDLEGHTLSVSDDLVLAGDGSDTLTVSEGSGNDTLIGGEGGNDEDQVDLSSLRSAVTVTYTGDEAGTVSVGPSFVGAFARTISLETSTISFSQTESLLLTRSNDSVDGSADTAGLDIDAGDGDDFVQGGGAADSVFGGKGSDSILGGAGDDTLDGGQGDDTLHGGDGDDYVETGDSNDLVFGDAGNDTIVDGGSGTKSSTVHAGAGDDSIVGGMGNSRSEYFGDAGNDVFTDQGGGSQLFDGGEGNDTFHIDFVGSDTIVGGDGNADAMDFSGSAVNVSIEHGADGTGTVKGSGDTLSFSGIEEIWLTDKGDSLDGGTATTAVTYYGAGGDDTLLGGAGNDTLSGGDGSDLIDGGAGDDYLTTGLGDDTLLGGEGDDILLNSAGDDSLVGGAGNDSIVATAGNDTLEGGDGNDTMYGGAGTDRLVGGAGADSMAGEADADTFVIEDRFGADTIDGGSTGDDNDMIDLSAMTTAVTVTYTGDEAGWITDGTDTLTFSDIEQFILTDQADVVDAGADRVGVDIDAGAGDDTIEGSLSSDSLQGGAGDDHFIVTHGSNTLTGGDGSDYFEVGYGNDTIIGGSGGTDQDTLSIAEADDNVNVVFTSDGTGSYFDDDGDSGSFSEVEVFKLSSGADTVDGTADTAGFEVQAGAGNDSVLGGSGADTLSGEAGADTLKGGAGNDSVSGGDGADLLKGETGNDSISGGDGPDSLLGGDGDDTLFGGTGGDSVSGGDGDDVFIYHVGDGPDVITDFNTGNTGALWDGDNTNNDFVDLSGFYDHINELRADFHDDGVLNQSNATAIGGGAVDYSDNDQFGPGNSLTFQGASQSSFSEDNTGVVCFTKGTLISTPAGMNPIEDLKVGDLVCTRENGVQPLIWIGRRQLDHNALLNNPKLRPVQLAPELIGADQPLTVSRQHALLLRCEERGEILVRAIHLARRTGPQARVLRNCTSVCYYHLLFEDHQIVFANGAPTESFYPGPQAVSALSKGARSELAALFPNLPHQAAETAYGPTVREIATIPRLPSDITALRAAAF